MGTMWSGWSWPFDMATICAWPSMSTQEKSSPSYRIDEYAVRTSVMRISRTIETKASRSTSSVMGSIMPRSPLVEPQVAVPVDLAGPARRQHRRRAELLHDGRPVEPRALGQPLALPHRTVRGRAIEPDRSPLDQRLVEDGAWRSDSDRRGLGHQADRRSGAH